VCALGVRGVVPCNLFALINKAKKGYKVKAQASTRVAIEGKIGAKREDERRRERRNNKRLAAND
jgi:hypothetical protein